MSNFLRQTRVRIAGAYTLVFTLVAILAATGFWVVFRQTEYSAVDNSLSAQAQALVSGLDEASGRVTFQGADGLPGETSEGIAIAAVLKSGDGRILDRSGLAPPVQGVPGAGYATSTLGGHRERVLVLPVRLTSDPHALLIVTRPVGELDATLTRTALFLALGVLLLALTASVGGYWLAGRALKPVRQIAATARELSERDLHRRIDLDLPPDELGELADTFNGMLSRLEAAFDGLRRFTADAAHDLRAPLALVMLEVEVALKRTRTPDGYRESLGAVRSELQRLSRMVDQLLILARDDAGALQPQFAEVDLSDLLEESVSRWRPLAQERGISLGAELPGSGKVQGDADMLRRVVDNLLDNAVRHTPIGGAIGVHCVREGAGWCITVTDTGPGVDPSLRPNLFERFTRADPARGRETGGAGLGLSLCAVIVRLHGGEVHLQSTEAGASFLVRLPAQQASRASAGVQVQVPE